jgi:hypothetical protein
LPSPPTATQFPEPLQETALNPPDPLIAPPGVITSGASASLIDADAGGLDTLELTAEDERFVWEFVLTAEAMAPVTKRNVTPAITDATDFRDLKFAESEYFASLCLDSLGTLRILRTLDVIFLPPIPGQHRPDRTPSQWLRNLDLRNSRVNHVQPNSLTTLAHVTGSRS